MTDAAVRTAPGTDDRHNSRRRPDRPGHHGPRSTSRLSLDQFPDLKLGRVTQLVRTFSLSEDARPHQEPPMTKPMITMPSEDVLGSLVMAIEETALREHGWDRIPMLMTVQQIRSNVLDVWEAPIDATASNMLQLAGEISTADSEVSRLLRDDLVHCRTLAWVLLDTTVANMAMKGTDYLITKVQDHPESRETRFAFAMDLLGRTYVILRPRNQPARAADATSIAGNIPSALRIFNLAVARQLADNEDMIKGLMNLEVQTGLELDVAALHADPYVRFLSK